MDFSDLNPNADDYAAHVLERILHAALRAGASDIHVTQASDTISLRWRVAGRLLDLGTLPDGTSTKLLGRIKAAARLVTYRNDIPQEGRMFIRAAETIEARVGTLPLLHGERAVIRLSTQHDRGWFPEQLGLSNDVLQRLTETLATASGVVLITGPAGAGKTTTGYACLRSMLLDPQPRSIVSLEDPVEAEINGVAQAQVDPAGEFNWHAGLKALLRQDPEVMLVGEIRDAGTAAIVFQAAMTGQLVVTTMHARGAADALRRLLDMGVPSHHLRSALDLLLCQRLLPRRCECQSIEGEHASSCEACGSTGVRGQLLIAEMLPRIEGPLAEAIVQDTDTLRLQQAAIGLGMRDLATLAQQAIGAGKVSAEQVNRKL